MNTPAKQQKTISRWAVLLLLCSVFTFAQTATLSHSVEHNHDDHHEYSLSCEVFASFSNLGLACTNVDTIHFHPAATVLSITALPELLAANSYYPKSIRAPPSLTV